MKKLIIILFVLLSYLSKSQEINLDFINVDSIITSRNTLDTLIIYDKDEEGLYYYQNAIVDFKSNVAVPAHKTGRMFYDSLNHCFSYYNDESEVSMQIGLEQWTRVLNESGSTTLNGKIVYISGANAGNPTIELANAKYFDKTDGLIGFATHDIETGTFGLVTTGGEVRGLSTIGCPAGSTIYLDTISGEHTSNRLKYPNYLIEVGTCLFEDATNGKILVNIKGQTIDIIQNAFNGSFIESINFTIDSDGTTITGTLDNNNGRDSLTMHFSDGFTYLDVSTPPTIELSAGTAISPQLNYIYIPITTKLLTVSSSYWPTATEHIKVCTAACLDATNSQQQGTIRNQNWNDHLAGSSDNMGHIQHLSERLRQNDAIWQSGSAITVSVTNTPSLDSVKIATTVAKIYQLHLQTVSAFDMDTGTDIHIVNDFVNPYTTTTNIANLLTDSQGATLSNRDFSFVVWGIANRTGQMSHLMINLPSGSYASVDDAISDVESYSNYTIPNAFKGVGYLIARLTFSRSPAGGGTWTLEDTQDLRGYLPNRTAGGGFGGGGGVTDFVQLVDVPSSYIGQAGKILFVSESETAVEFSDKTTTDLDSIGINSDSIRILSPIIRELESGVITGLTNNYYPIWNSTLGKLIDSDMYNDGAVNFLGTGALAEESFSVQYGNTAPGVGSRLIFETPTFGTASITGSKFQFFPTNYNYLSMHLDTLDIDASFLKITGISEQDTDSMLTIDKDGFIGFKEFTGGVALTDFSSGGVYAGPLTYDNAGIFTYSPVTTALASPDYTADYIQFWDVSGTRYKNTNVATLVNKLPDATTSTRGQMSAADKTIVDGLGTISVKDFWNGSQASYDALTPNSNTIYFINQ